MKRIRQRSSQRAALSAAAGFLLVLALSAVLLPSGTALGTAVPDVSGDWQWESQTIILVPGNEFTLSFFEVESEGPVLRVICELSGSMNIVQNGSLFTGTADQFGSCTTQGGQSAKSPFPPFFEVEGSIQGHSIHIDNSDDLGGVCSWEGSLTVQNGVATRFNTAGGCDPNLPVHPLIFSKDIYFDGVRQ